jgi:hypothetical protein
MKPIWAIRPKLAIWIPCWGIDPSLVDRIRTGSLKNIEPRKEELNIDQKNLTLEYYLRRKSNLNR